MIQALVVALAAAVVAPSATAPVNQPLMSDAAHAIAAGRLDQARLMIGRAVASGATGSGVERLLADLAFASGNYTEALARYQQLAAADRKDASICEQAGIAALRIDRVDQAAPLIDCATAAPGASWKSWNARGVLADLERDWTAADAAYEQAHRLAPREAGVINNQGFSQLLRGDWAGAAERFEQAARLDPNSSRIANNLELARAALAKDLPRRWRGESDGDWAERLNDAGVAAQLLGDTKRAIAAFSQSLEASDNWYPRAANNLEAASKP